MCSTVTVLLALSALKTMTLIPTPAIRVSKRVSTRVHTRSRPSRDKPAPEAVSRSPSPLAPPRRHRPPSRRSSSRSADCQNATQRRSGTRFVLLSATSPQRHRCRCNNRRWRGSRSPRHTQPAPPTPTIPSTRSTRPTPGCPSPQTNAASPKNSYKVSNRELKQAYTLLNSTTILAYVTALCSLSS